MGGDIAVKTIILTFILLLLPFQLVWPDEDTTRVWCGYCYSKNSPDFLLSYCDSTVPRKLPINCYYKCIDGELYQICVTEDKREIAPIDSMTIYEAIRDKIFGAIVEDVWRNTQYDTIQVCDTSWLPDHFRKTEVEDSTWNHIRFDWVQIYKREINCRDTIVVKGQR